MILDLKTNKIIFLQTYISKKKKKNGKNQHKIQNSNKRCNFNKNLTHLQQKRKYNKNKTQKIKLGTLFAIDWFEK